MSDLDVAKSLRVIENYTRPLSPRPTASDVSDSTASSPADFYNVRVPDWVSALLEFDTRIAAR